jgi:hypothetical protein
MVTVVTIQEEVLGHKEKAWIHGLPSGKKEKAAPSDKVYTA